MNANYWLNNQFKCTIVLSFMHRKASGNRKSGPDDVPYRTGADDFLTGQLRACEYRRDVLSAQ